MQIARIIYVKANHGSGGINGKAVGEHGVEGWRTRHINGDGGGCPPALQEPMLIATGIVV